MAAIIDRNGGYNTKNSLSYTGRDVTDIRRELVDLIPTLTSKWTDFNESDLGMTIVELIAAAQDFQNFYLDTQTFETFLDTAQQDKNLRSILRTMNYRIPLASTARGILNVEFASDGPKEIYIPKYTTVTSSRADITQIYLTSDAVDVNGNISSLEIPIMEGEVHSIQMNRNSFKKNINSSGNVSRRVYLGFSNVADHSVEIRQDGVIWEECDDALLKYHGGYYFSVHKDSKGQVYVLMSVNFMELLPLDDTENITIYFVTTSGIPGQVVSNTLNNINYNFGSYQVSYIGNNYSTAGASNEPEPKNLRVLAREHAITMDRFITLEDYKNGVDTEPYVFKSVVKDWKTLEFVDQPFIVKVWAVDATGYTIGDEYAKRLKQKLTDKGVVDVDVQVQKVETVEIDLSVKISTKVRTVNESEIIKNSVIDYLRDTYKVESMDFGKTLSYSYLVSGIRAVSPYISGVLVETPSEDVEIGPTQFPIVKNIKVEMVEKF